jgi:hypothetical protein
MLPFQLPATGTLMSGGGRGVDCVSIHMSNDPTKNRQRVCQWSGKGPNRMCPDNVSAGRPTAGDLTAVDNSRPAAVSFDG